MNFRALLSQVLAELRLRRDNGEFTERELARRAKLSQPHLNHVFSGVRVLTPEVADKLLRALGLEIAGNRAGDRLLVDGPADFRLVDLGRNCGDALRLSARRANRADLRRASLTTQDFDGVKLHVTATLAKF